MRLRNRVLLLVLLLLLSSFGLLLTLAYSTTHACVDWLPWVSHPPHLPKRSERARLGVPTWHHELSLAFLGLALRRVTFGSERGTANLSWPCRSSALMNVLDWRGALALWQEAINKQIARSSPLCAVVKCHLYIPSMPLIINTHKPNDAWLLQQSLPH